MRAFLHVSLAGALLVSTGCFTVRANTPSPLNVPEPPSKVVMPPPAAADPPATVPPPPATPPAANVPPPAPANPNPARPNPPAAPPPATTTPPEASPILQTTINTDEIQRRIQGQLKGAKRDLDKVDRNTLSKEERDQYDWALRMYREAEKKVDAKDYNNADQLANKAARLASLLVKGAHLPHLPFNSSH